jgi:hypothetical protein
VAVEQQKAQYLLAVAPKAAPASAFDQQPRSPSKQAITDWGIVLAAAHDPAAVFEKVASGGTARPSEIDCIQNCYPQLYAAAQKQLVEKLAKGGGNAPTYMRMVAISQLTGIPLADSLTPDGSAWLQSGHKSTPAPQQGPGSAPSPTLSNSINVGQQTLSYSPRRYRPRGRHQRSGIKTRAFRACPCSWHPGSLDRSSR